MANEQRRVLLIDDNQDILFMVKTMLQMRGFSVTAKEGPQNIEQEITAVKPDVILMDMLMSGNDGREICKKIKSQTVLSDIPIIMISALPDAAASCVDAGADFFLGKPFEMADLFSVVDNAFSIINK